MGANRTIRILLLTVMIAGAVIRCAYLLEQSHSPAFLHPRLDAQFHDLWARSILHGNLAGDEVFFRAPFYPYFLAAIYATAGDSPVSPRLIQHLIGVLLIPVVFSLTRRITGRTYALVAALVTACYPVFPFFEGELLFDSLVAFLFALYLLLLIRADEHPSVSRWAIGGLVLGLLCVTRPPFLLFVPLTCVVCSRNPVTPLRRRLRLMTVFSLAVAIVVLPVTLRNWIVGDDVVLISSQGGVNFFIGNNPDADGISSAMPGALGASWENVEADRSLEQEYGRPLKPSELSRAWYSKGMAFIVSRPGQALKLFLKKALLFWDGREIPNNRSYASARSTSSILGVLPGGFWLIGPPALVAMILLRKQRMIRMLTYAIVAYMLVVVAFFVSDRYRLPIVPLAIILASALCAHTIELARRRDWKNLIPVTVLLAVCSGAVSGNLLGVEIENPAREHLRKAMLDVQSGRPADALATFRSAETGGRVLPNYYLTWGIATLASGRPKEALRLFRRELSLFPGSYCALVNAGIVEYELGNTRTALEVADSAITRRPYVGKGYVLAARSEIALGLEEQATARLEEGVRRVRGAFHYGRILLAGIRSKQGEIARAEGEYNRILSELDVPPQPVYAPEYEFQVSDDWGESDSLLRSRAYYGLAHCSVADGDLANAVQLFQRSVQEWNENANAWADLGITYHHRHEPGASYSALSQAIQLDPKNPQFRIARARAAYQLHRFDDARKDLLLLPTDSTAVQMLKFIP